MAILRGLATGFEAFADDVAISGDVALVGANSHSAVMHNAGMVYVYERDAGGPDQWSEVAQLQPTGLASNDRLGPVSIDGDTALIGARGHGVGGAAWIYMREASGWTESAKLTREGAAEGDAFGANVLVRGDVAFVPAARAMVVVFERDAGGPDAWGQVAEVTPDETVDDFGRSLALSGSTLLIGSRRAAFFFERDEQGVWGQTRRIDGEPEFGFTYAVAIDRDTAAIGSNIEMHPIGDLTGAVHMLERNQGGPGHWGEIARRLPPGASGYDRFGAALAAADSLLVAGAPSHDDPLFPSGIAVIYELGVCTACVADLDGSGAVDFADVRAVLSAWGNAGGPEDLDDDGSVDLGDLLIVLVAWGPC